MKQLKIPIVADHEKLVAKAISLVKDYPIVYIGKELKVWQKFDPGFANIEHLCLSFDVPDDDNDTLNKFIEAWQQAPQTQAE